MSNQSPFTLASDTRSKARRFEWLAALLVAALSAVVLGPSVAQAGTITIVDGPDTTPPVNGVYTDGYIQSHLNTTGSLTISTTGVLDGPDEIRVLQSAVITWTSANTLTLDAGANVVISGTVQHDGPATGGGGLTLLASALPTGTVFVGPGDQTTGSAAGSRHGLTRVRAGNLALLGGGSGTEPYALLGFRAVDQGAAYSVTGAISVTLGQSLTVTGGAADFGFAQIGHGGNDPANTELASGAFTGIVTAVIGGNATFVGGGPSAYAQLGNGGDAGDGDHGGDHRLDVGGNVSFQAGAGNAAYAQMGNGGSFTMGSQSGNLHMAAGGTVSFQGGGDQAYAQLGNGGLSASGSHSGSHTLRAEGAAAFLAGAGFAAYAQLGNGGQDADGNHSGNHALTSDADVTFQAGNNTNAYAQLGNGGLQATGNHGGGHNLTGAGTVTYQGGAGFAAYAQLGDGGYNATGNHSGGHNLTAAGIVTYQGGSGFAAYAQMGNGGYGAAGNHTGAQNLQTSADVSFDGGGGGAAYAQLGNGGSFADGDPRTISALRPAAEPTRTQCLDMALTPALPSKIRARAAAPATYWCAWAQPPPSAAATSATSPPTARSL
jgi:hypothetical protein